MAFSLVPSKLFLARLKKLDKSIVLQLEKKLEHIQANPISSEHRMHHAHNYYRVYLKNFMVIYKVEGNSVILFDILNREDGYAQYSAD
ncbi:type II toxin-antitoxin system RelE/ParE family toxin [Candidatus Micrarchaeota archaeon]|nr:type II toxin-antitoxin system RelE/ParE family toxin [Candidatus Micrarchaeota archaeon]